MKIYADGMREIQFGRSKFQSGKCCVTIKVLNRKEKTEDEVEFDDETETQTQEISLESKVTEVKQLCLTKGE